MAIYEMVTYGLSGHTPVLREEVLAHWLPEGRVLPTEHNQPDLFVDCTLGGAGHSQALIERYRDRYGEETLASRFMLLGIDQDQSSLGQAAEFLKMRFPTLENRIITSQRNFSQLGDILKEHRLAPITGGLLADIGASSFQFDQGERGFSFNKTAPLDMRMDQSQEITAARVVNTYDEKQLVRLFSEYGEERFSKTVARLICERRKAKPFETTTDLSEMIVTLYRQKLPPKAYRIHPATKVFQALRIEVNQELSVLEKLVAQLPEVLSPGARACVLSFHSLEDRIVKNAFRGFYQNDGPLKLITRKPIIGGEAEIEENPRARSAKLRCAERR